ncbi:mannose-6-phosphate isomerase, class I [Chitinophagaceae bacterium IBVUCB2]|nr:mannose-6-phosphate isomerase, class I [Chitinophagaceae bacterium IBVUCB2]
MAGIYKLEGAIKHYDWGGYTFIPTLLQKENKEGKPFAEYWMGIHPLGVGQVITKDGKNALTNYSNSLSYLLKVLDVKDMLSIQVHPSKEAAEKEYARENAAGIPLESPQRNYKDDNHKPELMVALSDFWLLHGFKPAEELVYTLLNVVELRELLPVFNQSGYSGLYKYIMEMPQEEVNRILQPLLDNIDAIYKEGTRPDKYDEDYWASKAAKTFVRNGDIDRGIFSIYLFNLVHLKKGEGVFQADGVPHAYLEGQNVELMANSDNVLRGGLTTKHIDVVELMKHIKCEATTPNILQPEAINSDEKKYLTPVNDFQLNVIELEPNQVATFSTTLTEILLLTEGAVEVSSGDSSIELKSGSVSAVVLPGTTVVVKGRSKATIYRASTAINNR